MIEYSQAAAIPPQDGEARKLQAHGFLRARRREVTQRAARLYVAIAMRTGIVTGDDVREELGDLPPGINAVCLGSVPGELARAGIIAADGFMKSRRPEAHARPITRWRLLSSAAALAWLRTNTPRPADATETPAPATPTPAGMGEIEDNLFSGSVSR